VLPSKPLALPPKPLLIHQATPLVLKVPGNIDTPKSPTKVSEFLHKEPQLLVCSLKNLWIDVKHHVQLQPVLTETINCQFARGELKRCEVLGQVSLQGSIKDECKEANFALTLKGREFMENALPNKVLLQCTSLRQTAKQCLLILFFAISKIGNWAWCSQHCRNIRVQRPRAEIAIVHSML